MAIDFEDRESLERRHGDLAWLVTLRWIAIAGVIVAGLLAARLGIIAPPDSLLAVAAAMLVFNAGLHIWRSRVGDGMTHRRHQYAIVTQLTADVLALVTMLHLAGGVENPFAFFLVFHMAIAAMLLDSLSAWTGGLVAGAAYCALVLAEFFGLLPHFDLALFERTDALQAPYRSVMFIAGHMAALLFGLAGTIYFVRALAARNHEVEARLAEHKRIALVRERMARIGEISAGVAHAVRNPLHGLLNCVDILRSSHKRPEDVEILDLMHEGMSRIQVITQRLLTLGADTPLDCRPSQLAVLVQDAVQFLKVRGRHPSVRVHVDLRAAPEVLVDPDRLGEAILNILDNAIFAAKPAGNVHIRLLTPFGAPPPVHLEIQDDGVGIPEESLDLVFHPFFTTKAVGEGTGLGLAISRRVVEEHGGTITIESKVGEGTTVRITLPPAAYGTNEAIP